MTGLLHPNDRSVKSVGLGIQVSNRSEDRRTAAGSQRQFFTDEDQLLGWGFSSTSLRNFNFHAL